MPDGSLVDEFEVAVERLVVADQLQRHPVRIGIRLQVLF